MRDALGAVQSVLVLGGYSDIGLATAQAFVRRRPADVVLAGRDVTALEAAARQLERAGAANVETVHFDALDTDSHLELIADLFERRDVDVVVFAFGLLGDQERAKRDHDLAVRLAQVNYVGTVSVGIPLAERMRAQGHGTVIVLSSVAAERARPSNWVYGSTKAAQDSFAEGLAHHLAGSGVRVLTVRPGFVRTKMTAGLEQAPFATTPDAVAEAIADAVRTGREVTWVPAILRWVFLAIRLLPRVVLRRLPL